MNFCSEDNQDSLDRPLTQTEIEKALSSFQGNKLTHNPTWNLSSILLPLSQDVINLSS